MRRSTKVAQSAWSDSQPRSSGSSRHTTQETCRRLTFAPALPPSSATDFSRRRASLRASRCLATSASLRSCSWCAAWKIQWSAPGVAALVALFCTITSTIWQRANGARWRWWTVSARRGGQGGSCCGFRSAAMADSAKLLSRRKRSPTEFFDLSSLTSRRISRQLGCKRREQALPLGANGGAMLEQLGGGLGRGIGGGGSDDRRGATALLGDGGLLSTSSGGGLSWRGGSGAMQVRQQPQR